MKKRILPQFIQAKRLSFSMIFRTGSFYGNLSIMDESGQSSKAAYAMSAALPFILCLALLNFFSGVPASIPFFIFLGYTIATLFLAASVFFITGRIFGKSRSYFCTVCAWAQTYWATAFFLGLLAISHFVPALFSSSPGSLPSFVKYLFLSFYLTAGFWKFLLMISMLKYLFRIEGWRLLVSSLLLMAVASGFVLLSALLIGTKVPVL